MEVRTVNPGTKQRYAVGSVVKVEMASDGSVTRTKIGGRRKKRVSKKYRGLDKMLRRMSQAQNVAARDYLDRHDRSNKRKKNGAIRDLTKNMKRSQRKGVKRLKIKVW